MTEKFDLYAEVTARILEAMEGGKVPWLKPWKNSRGGSVLEPYNAFSGRPYSGINWVLLQSCGFEEMGWLTFKQAKELGAMVKKGSKSTMVVYWSRMVKEDKETGEEKTIMLAKAYRVFNLEQIEGLDPAKLKQPEAPVVGEGAINKLAASNGARVKHGGDRAFFCPSGDYIAMPSHDAFEESHRYDSTLAHELVHWTGHESRLARDFSGRFGSESYAFEELIAELGSAFTCARLGLRLETLQHAGYLQSWIKVLKEDKRAIFTASSQAQKALGFLLEKHEELEAA